VVTLADGRKIATLLEWYPRLQRASAKERANFEIMPMGIHWPDLDEDLGIAGMLKVCFGAAMLVTQDPSNRLSRETNSGFGALDLAKAKLASTPCVICKSLTYGGNHDHGHARGYPYSRR
jgi:hypothetical protein